jgi:hypothetical protein
VALLLAGAVLAALPGLAGGLQVWVGERVELPFAVVDPGIDVPGIDVPGAEAPQSSGAEATRDPRPPAAGQAGPAREAGETPADDRSDPGDDRDQDDDSGGSGRSGGDDDSGGGGSSGPGVRCGRTGFLSHTGGDSPNPVDSRPVGRTWAGPGFAAGFGEVVVLATRPTLTVLSIPLSCQPVPGVPDGCQVGGSGLAAGLGKVRVYASVRLGQPRPGGCREASTTGSISGAAWSAPFAGGGEWCGQRARFTYRLEGPTGGEGRLEYRHEPPTAPTATFSGALPAPPATEAARDPARRVDSAGCGRRPPVRPGRSGDLEIKADPVVSAGAARRGYRVHVPAGYRPGRAVPAVLLLHGNGGSAADLGTDDVVVPYGGRTPTVGWPLAVPPMPTWLAGWATRDGCPGDPAVFLDTPAATGVRWSGCRDGSEVVHYRINGGDHQAHRTIAGRSFAQVVWDFFAAHPLPG